MNNGPTPITHEALGAQPSDSRPLHVFTLSERMQKLYGIKEIGIVEITAREHTMAMKRVRDAAGNIGTAVLSGFELALESLKMVDGRRLSTGDGSADAFWNSTHQSIRELVVAAYGEVNTVGKEDTDAFLKSRGLKTV